MVLEKRQKEYVQLLRIQINKARYIVVSKQPDGRISMAQQIRVTDYGDRDEYLFLKNSFVFESDEAFENFRKELLKIDISKIK